LSDKIKYHSENIRVTKHFMFEMAHVLHNYDGPCRNIHGHSYKLSVTLIGKPLLCKNHPKDGLVIDFSDIKEAVQKEILDHFDYALVLNRACGENIKKILSKQFDKILTLPCQPSCENLVIEFKNRLENVFNHSCRLISLRLKETSSSWAEWNLSDNIH